ncbi:MAG TPA: hypothetical protein VGR19_11380 [Allosphingosinicella sp.]|nr:hypothetical protein [Allosphingosinicella sp.]
MPRYFFTIYDDLVSEDEEGRDLPDVETAKAEAIKGARELMCEELRNGRLVLRDHHIEVVDEVGKRVADIAFKDVIRIEG